MRVEAGTDAALIARMLELIPAREGSAKAEPGQEPSARQAVPGELPAVPPGADQPSPPDAPASAPAPVPVAATPSSPVIVWLPAPQPAPSHTTTDPDHDAPAKRVREEAGEVAFVLHVPSAGAIEIRLALIGGAVRAAVTTPAGEIGDRALIARDDLIARLTRATGRPAVADVRIRPKTHIDLHA